MCVDDIILGLSSRLATFLSQSCSFGLMPIFSFCCFLFVFRGRDHGSECVSFWSFFTFYLLVFTKCHCFRNTLVRLALQSRRCDWSFEGEFGYNAKTNSS